MFKKKLTALFILSLAIFVVVAGNVQAQSGSVVVQNSKITGAPVWKGTERLLPESVPAEFNQAFDKLLQQGAGKFTGGEREVLALLGNFKTATRGLGSFSRSAKGSS